MGELQIQTELLMDIPALVKSLDLDTTRIEVDFGYRENDDIDFYRVNKFLEFAQLDFAQGDTRGYVNALTNCKRAIDWQINKSLDCFGMSTSHKSLPKKMAILRSMGILAPKIIEKINSIRNGLEHEFTIPSAEDVENATDIVELFVSALDHRLANIPSQVWIMSKLDRLASDKCLFMGYDEVNHHFLLEGLVLDDLQQSQIPMPTHLIGQSILGPTNEKLYTEVIRVAYKRGFTPHDCTNDITQLLAMLQG
jgi:hypothetical protein